MVQAAVLLSAVRLATMIFAASQLKPHGLCFYDATAGFWYDHNKVI
jgi:hypothetical protein